VTEHMVVIVQYSISSSGAFPGVAKRQRSRPFALIAGFMNGVVADQTVGVVNVNIRRTCLMDQNAGRCRHVTQAVNVLTI